MPEVAAALARDGSLEVAGAWERPFRIASITKSFTATALAEAGLVDDRVRALLTHTAGYRPESPVPLPDVCDGLWSYSNAGYREAGELLGDYSDAVRELVLEPLGLGSTGFEQREGAVLGTLPGEVTADPAYPVVRRPAGGLWSTVSDLVTYGFAHCERWPETKEPVAAALGARYALGWWVRDGLVDHEGSVGGYQSLLLLAPSERLVLAVLTNSWRGSTAIRHVVDDLGIVTTSNSMQLAPGGRYELDGLEAVVSDGNIVERERDPSTGATIERRYPWFGTGASLMSWRSDVPRDGVAHISWTAVPQVG